MLPLIIGIEASELSEAERKAFAKFKPAGYILFSRNILDVELCRELSDELRSIHRSIHPPIIAIDQEGGRVVRSSQIGIELPSASQLAATKNSHFIQQAAYFNARTLHQLGVNTNFAPVLDIASSEQNALASRCWGNNSQDVISYAGIWNRSLLRQGIMTCGKHFPGMGNAQSDPHFSLPKLEGDFEHFLDEASIPFLALMPELPSLMMAHLSIPEMDAQYPSSLSARIVTQFLRQQLGYEGIVFTDDLGMGAICESWTPSDSYKQALLAGCDLPLLCHDSLSQLECCKAMLKDIPLELLRLQSKRIYRFALPSSPPQPLPFIAWRELRQHCAEFCHKVTEQMGEDSARMNSPVEDY